MNFSDDEKIALGDFCEQVLLSDAFSAVTKQYEESTVQQLITTKSTETKRRDELYFNLRGVRDFLDLMHSKVKEKDQLLYEDITAKPSDEDRHIDIYSMPDDASDDDVL